MSTEKSTAERITDVVKDYYRYKDKAGIEGLIRIRKNLAVLKYGLATEVAELYTEKNGAEFRRKAEYYRKKKELLKTSTIGKAETEAEVLIEELRKEEQMADALYKSASFILDSAKDVLDALSQHIANLRQEKREEMTGQGSQ